MIKQTLFPDKSPNKGNKETTAREQPDPIPSLSRILRLILRRIFLPLIRIFFLVRLRLTSLP
jgi:hypothetical protein